MDVYAKLLKAVVKVYPERYHFYSTPRLVHPNR